MTQTITIIADNNSERVEIRARITNKQRLYREEHGHLKRCVEDMIHTGLRGRFNASQIRFK